MMRKDTGYTIVELLVSLAVLSVIALSLFGLYTSLLHSTVVAKRRAVAMTLAVNQMESLKGLPYNNLAVAGGPIVSSSYVPAHITEKVDGDTYTVTTNISYADDAYDGCGSYPTQALKQQYCRNYPPPSGAPAVDNNPADYKDVNVTVDDSSNNQLAMLDTDVAALVAETASNTGALFVKVLDSSGNPVTGALVQVVNNALSPTVNVSDTTDENGIVIFYGMPPDNNNDYVATASEGNYSSLSTIAVSGALQPTYPNQKLIAQNSSLVTLTINPQGVNSLILESTDVNGNPLPNAKIYVKGGYKKYTSSSDTQYYYDTLTPTDTRPTTDGSGLAGLTNLAPGNYIFCGDAGATSCKVGNTTYYLAAAVPYGGNNSFYPITVPSYSASNPPPTTYTYGSNSYLQKVRLLLTTNSNFPRITSVSPFDVSLSGGTANNFPFNITGNNLPCSSNASSCGTTVKLVQGGNTYTASCTGAATGLQLNCTVNVSTAATGLLQLVVAANGYTFTLPAGPLLGGISVTP